MGTPPVIIIGMHRSGTSLITRLLEGTGLFVGKKLESDHEALFFLALNSWLLSAAGGRWDVPGPIDYALADSEGRDHAVEYLRLMLSASPSRLRFMGAAKLLRYRSIFNLKEPWGFKDPRSTVTLPFWLELFPEARVIHIVRNGLDVASSLRKRQLAGSKMAIERFYSHRTLVSLRGKEGWFGDSPRLMDLRQGVELWQEYLQFAERHTRDISRENLRELRFEDFVNNPGPLLENLAGFCGLSPSPARVKELCRRINESRAGAFAGDPELLALWQDVKGSKWMQKYGYDRL